MNKQELIEYCESLKGDLNKFINGIDVNKIISKIEQLDEPQKPVVPQFVADWLEKSKNELSLREAMSQGYAPHEVDRWLREMDQDGACLNQETFAQAYMFGYTIKEEEQYLVKLKGVIKGTKVLKHNKSQDTWYMGTIYGCDSLESFHTKEELEKAGFGEVFNSPLFEVEEVEE